MKTLFLVLVLLLPLGAAAQRVALVDRIVAVVNKDVITATELDDAVSAAERQLQRQGTRLPYVASEFDAVGVVMGGSRGPEAAQRDPRIVEIGGPRRREHCRRRDASHNFVS